jgi:hypothetical protein
MNRTLNSQDLLDLFDSAIQVISEKDEKILSNMLYMFRRIAEDPSAHEALAVVNEDQLDAYVHNMAWSFNKIEAEAVAKVKRSEYAKAKRIHNSETFAE